MDGEFDLGSAIEQIQNMMSTDDGQAKLNNIINAFTGPDQSEEEKVNKAPHRPDVPDIGQMDLMIKLGNVLSAVKNQKNSKSADLLYAIKPYLNDSRRMRTDGAVKILGMVKALALIKESGIELDF